MREPPKIAINDHSEVQKEAEIEPKNESRIDNVRSDIRMIFNGLWNGIPIELAFTISPEMKNTILKEFRRDGASLPINQQVHLMLGLLKKYFPELVEHSQKWMAVRAYLFNRIGLWGKFG